MRRIKLLVPIALVLLSWHTAFAALPDNWLTRVLEKRLHEKFRNDGDRIDKIIEDIKREQKGKEFASKENLRKAVKNGLVAARARQKKLKELPIGPTPAQSAAVQICAELALDYPEAP